MELRVVNLESAEHIRIVKKKIRKPVGMHLHSFYELEMVLSGTGEQNLNGTVYPIGPDSVYFLTPIDFHAVTPHGDMEIVNISFDETLLSPQLRLLFMNRRDNFIFTDQGSALRHTVELLQQEQERHDEYSEICRRDLLEVVLYAVARRKGRGYTGSTQVHSSMQYLFRHFREDISLETVAAQSGYTPNYFSYLFHEITGEKFVDFWAIYGLITAKCCCFPQTFPWVRWQKNPASAHQVPCTAASKRPPACPPPHTAERKHAVFIDKSCKRYYNDTVCL